MISLQSSMHSSQTKTEGPAISFLTSCWLFPQNEQYRVFSLEVPFFSAMETVPFQQFGVMIPKSAAPPCDPAGAPGYQERLAITWSTSPYSLASSADM
jgi:hypothetical protein